MAPPPIPRYFCFCADLEGPPPKGTRTTRGGPCQPTVNRLLPDVLQNSIAWLLLVFFPPIQVTFQTIHRRRHALPTQSHTSVRAAKTLTRDLSPSYHVKDNEHKQSPAGSGPGSDLASQQPSIFEHLASQISPPLHEFAQLPFKAKFHHTMRISPAHSAHRVKCSCPVTLQATWDAESKQS